MLYLLGIIVLCFGEQIPAILLVCVSFNHLPARNNEIKKGSLSGSAFIIRVCMCES